jgi:hypothetical protein
MNCQIPSGRRMMLVTNHLLIFKQYSVWQNLLLETMKHHFVIENTLFSNEAVLTSRMTSDLFACCDTTW